MLMSLGINICKYFTLLDSKEIKSKYLEKSNDLKTERFPFVKRKQ